MSIGNKTRTLGRAIVRMCPCATYLLIPMLRLADKAQGGELHRHVQENIDCFCTPEQKNDPAYLRRLRRDMWYCSIRYLCAFNEYFIFGFPRLSHAGRQEFVTELEKDDACNKLSSDATKETFLNKWKTYELFGRFYKRDVIRAGSELAEDVFYEFAQKHPRFIVKPYNESCGVGVHICDTRTDGRSLSEFLAHFRTQDVLLEELIVQADAMARLHPSSVNTVRAATFYRDGQAHILFTFLRMGQSGSVVDNAGAGGFVAAVDTQTGIVITPGVTEALESTLIHPDTGVQILGMQIPRWEELKALARELAAAFPAQPYISWDLALTDGGWVMVEGNSTGQFVCPQFTQQRGIRSVLAPYFDL